MPKLRQANFQTTNTSTSDFKLTSEVNRSGSFAGLLQQLDKEINNNSLEETEPNQQTMRASIIAKLIEAIEKKFKQLIRFSYLKHYNNDFSSSYSDYSTALSTLKLRLTIIDKYLFILADKEIPFYQERIKDLLSQIQSNIDLSQEINEKPTETQSVAISSNNDNELIQEEILSLEYELKIIIDSIPSPEVNNFLECIDKLLNLLDPIEVNLNNILKKESTEEIKNNGNILLTALQQARAEIYEKRQTYFEEQAKKTATINKLKASLKKNQKKYRELLEFQQLLINEISNLIGKYKNLNLINPCHHDDAENILENLNIILKSLKFAQNNKLGYEESNFNLGIPANNGNFEQWSNKTEEDINSQSSELNNISSKQQEILDYYNIAQSALESHKRTLKQTQIEPSDVITNSHDDFNIPSDQSDPTKLENIKIEEQKPPVPVLIQARPVEKVNEKQAELPSTTSSITTSHARIQSQIQLKPEAPLNNKPREIDANELIKKIEQARNENQRKGFLGKVKNFFLWLISPIRTKRKNKAFEELKGNITTAANATEQPQTVDSVFNKWTNKNSEILNTHRSFNLFGAKKPTLSNQISNKISSEFDGFKDYYIQKNRPR